MAETFTGSFTRQHPLPEAALEIVRGATLNRYNLAGSERRELAAPEAEFAAWQGAPARSPSRSGRAGRAVRRPQMRRAPPPH